MKGKLFLLPNLLDKSGCHTLFFPKSVDLAVQKLDGLIAESEKEARAFLKRFTFLGKTFRDVSICLFNEHVQEVDDLLQPMRQGQTWGLISDVGLPIIADPGYQLVRRAYDFAIEVEVFIGPTSVITALMYSGLPSQVFAFHGYFPRKCESELKLFEQRSKEEGLTQIFIEAPYRNQKMHELLLRTLDEKTQLCVARNLTFPTQGVETHLVGSWRRRTLPNIDKGPAVYLFNAKGN